MFYDFKKGLTYKQCFDSMQECFGDQCPSESSISFWFREFKRGRTDFEDEPRSGRPSEAATPENAERLRQLVETDRRVTMLQIQHHLNIGSAAAQKLIHDHLGLTKRSARWVPHNLTDEQRQARVDWCHFMLCKFNNGASRQTDLIITGDETWIYDYDPETQIQSATWCFPGEPSPAKVRRTRSVGKRMVAVFFNKFGLVAAVPLQERRTVNAIWYTTVCLPKVFQTLKNQRSGTASRNLRSTTSVRGVLLHHDNASSHTAAETLDFLEAEGVQLVTHPPYSPDLAPCDFWLFPKVKEQLRGRRFSSDSEALEAMDAALANLTEDSYKQCFERWFHRMNSCIHHAGHYFEKI